MPLLFFFQTTMIRLLTDTADQTIYLTLDEGRMLLPASFTHYLLIITREEKSDVGLSLAQVPTIVLDNTRFTQLVVTTETLTTPDRYRYEVYGQNSASNLDPNNAAVVGFIERGWFDITDETNYFSTPSTTIQDDFVNGE